MTDARPAPLHGLKIIEFRGLGPGPFAAMMLADMGADVIRIERPGASDDDPAAGYQARGRRSIALDLKQPAAVDIALDLIASADGLIEGFRPGVMERLGLGPDVAMRLNPKLVYGRMTGWGQDGPLAQSAGHDLNYIALTGALWASGPAEAKPQFPMNLLGDFGGGAMFLAFGMLAGLIQAERRGYGDVVDAAILDGTHALMGFVHNLRAFGQWTDQREANLLDGGAPWYAVYECADGGWISIAALEHKFWLLLLDKLGIDPAEFGPRENRANWPRIKDRFTTLFLAHPRDHWRDLLEATDVCFAPVLSPAEAAAHPHNMARRIFPTGGDQPAPAPRFHAARVPTPKPAPTPGADSHEILRDLGLDDDRIAGLVASGAVALG